MWLEPLGVGGKVSMKVGFSGWGGIFSGKGVRGCRLNRDGASTNFLKLFNIIKTKFYIVRLLHIIDYQKLLCDFTHL